MRQKIVLGLAFLLPGLVFIFLKFFGENVFDVPPLFQQEADIFPSDCGIHYAIPYVLADSIVSEFPFRDSAQFQIIAFPSEEIMQKKQLNRLREAFGDDGVLFTEVSKENMPDAGRLRHCIFLLQDPQQIVLIDRAGRIRGQYHGNSLEDMDRAMAELRILLKQY